MCEEISRVLMLWIVCSHIGSTISGLYGNTVPGWREPAGKVVTLDISFSGINPLHLGQTVNVTCVTHNHLDTATIELMQVTGRSQRRIKGHRSPLTHSWNVTEAEHGTRIYCGSVFISRVPDGSLGVYYAKSDLIPLEVRGVAKPASEPDPRERVYIRIYPQVDALNQFTRVQYVCDVENMDYPVVSMMHKKGNLEYQLYFGYQIGFRWMKQNVTSEDGGTQVYCEAHTVDRAHGMRAYAVMSELHNLTVIP